MKDSSFTFKYLISLNIYFETFMKKNVTIRSFFLVLKRATYKLNLGIEF